MRTFVRLCRKAFQFLEKEYGCAMVSVEDNVYRTCLTYQNQTTAVIISFEPREGGIFVRLVRLVNGKILPYPITIKDDTPLHGYYLDDLVMLRNPLSRIDRPPIDDLQKANVLSGVFTQHAKALRAYGGEILNGNFSVFSELEKIVKTRAATLRRDIAT